MKMIKPALLSLSLIALPGCLGPNIEPFLGSWSTSGTMTLTLNTPEGTKSDTSLLQHTVTVREGVGSDIILADSGCSVPATVEDEVATIGAGASCSSTGSNGMVVTMTYNGGSYVLSKRSMTFNASGTVTYVYQGNTYMGTFAMSGTHTKISK